MFLAGATWPDQLYLYPHARQQRLESDPLQVLLFSGVRVRIGLATGIVDEIRTHKVTQRVSLLLY